MPKPNIDADEPHITRALTLAQRDTALAHPNPRVGCVIVKNNRVIGEGFHGYDRLDHAEIVALKKAGKKARGATLYVTLEPCCTTGRTGPCTKPSSPPESNESSPQCRIRIPPSQAEASHNSAAQESK